MMSPLAKGRAEAVPTKYGRHTAKNDLQQVSNSVCYWSVLYNGLLC